MAMSPIFLSSLSVTKMGMLHLIPEADLTNEQVIF